ncbi:MAG: HAMP domain-containing histidine kinase [Chloroflexi bacterium]|nr:HAMP domain-containing histidine kinase [Chloroflexota bacterium]
MAKKFAPQQPKEIDYQEIAEAIVRMAPTYRAPYVSIIGFSEALLEGLSGKLSSAQASDVESVRVSGWQALGHLNDILDVMLLISGEIKYESHLLDLNQLLSDIVRDIERTRLEANQSLKLSLPEKALHIKGDELRLRQAILGLVGNSMVSASGAPIFLQASQEGEDVRIAIRDGCKVANEDDLSYFFEPGWMSKLENNRWRQMQWQSYLAHHFVRAHGGKIWAEMAEEDGEMPTGTQVTLTIPIAQES